MTGQVTDILEENPPSERRPILAPVDLSSCSEPALLFAAHLAGSTDAPLIILHVIHDSPDRPGFYLNGRQGSSGFTRPIEDVARDMLEEFVADASRYDSAREALAGARQLLVTGLPAQRIQQVAVHEDAALIVMGSHCRTGLSRLIGVSVAEDVLQHSRVPVTIVKGPQPEPSEKTADAMGSCGWWHRRLPLRAVDTPEESGI